MVEQQFEQKPTPEIIPKAPLEKEPKEGQVEVGIEKELTALEKEVIKEEQAGVAKPSYPTSQPVTTKLIKSETRKKIEQILSEDLVDIYRAMDTEQKSAFKQKGEETATAIEVLIQQAKATAKKIIKLIREWLKLIPGVNQFFLEQETKIKADKILSINKKKEN